MHEGRIECMYKACGPRHCLCPTIGVITGGELRRSTKGLLRAVFVSGERYDLVAGS